MPLARDTEVTEYHFASVSLSTSILCLVLAMSVSVHSKPSHSKCRSRRPANTQREEKKNLGGNMRDNDGTPIVAQHVEDYLFFKSSICPIREKNVKRVLGIICSLAQFCDSHYSMYNGVPMHMLHGFGCPRHYPWTLHRPIHPLSPSLQSQSTQT